MHCFVLISSSKDVERQILACGLTPAYGHQATPAQHLGRVCAQPALRVTAPALWDGVATAIMELHLQGPNQDASEHSGPCSALKNSVQSSKLSGSYLPQGHCRCSHVQHKAVAIVSWSSHTNGIGTQRALK